MPNNRRQITPSSVKPAPDRSPLRHATPADLDRLDSLLAQLRGVRGLRERKRGSFSRGTRAFLHFHADANALYADVRLENAFERLSVTTDHEQARFLRTVRHALRSPDS